MYEGKYKTRGVSNMAKNQIITEDINVQIYQQVLDGTLNKFPLNFWKEEYRSAPAIVRYLIEEVLKWDEEDIKEKYTNLTLKSNKLGGLLKYVYDCKSFDAIEAAYPGRFKPWEMKASPNSYWQSIENCVNATRWLILEKLKWTKEDIMKKYNKRVFIDNGFTGLLKSGWNGETYQAIALSFHEYDFKQWDLLAIPLTNFTKEEGKTAIKWYIEEKMNWTEKEIKQNWRSRNIQEDGIMRIVQSVFNNQMFDAIDSAYPNRFKRWEFPVTSGFWTLEKSKEALRWLVIEKLQLDPNEVTPKIVYDHIYEYNLSGMLKVGFQTGVKEAMQLTFPDELNL